MFSFKSPTVQMLGRWQPWHEGHTELFKQSIKLTGQVIIMCRDVQGENSGPGQDDNPWDYYDVRTNIISALEKYGYKLHHDYEVAKVPNIIDISYGRGVGYTFTEHDLGKDIHDISATQIRKQMREDGSLG